MKVWTILVINPGSTSTKIAVFANETCQYTETIHHSAGELNKYARIADQLDMRKQVILLNLAQAGIELSNLTAIVARGGLLQPLISGTYQVNERMLQDLRSETWGSHASNLGALIANELAADLQIPAFIVDPVVVDELQPLARYSGLPEIPRRSIFHALNQKAVAKGMANELHQNYDQLNLIVVHMGGGISVGAHRRGWVVDVNNALDGDGPFSPERSGGLTANDLVKLCFQENYNEGTLHKKIVGAGGLVAYLATNDAREVEKMIQAGDAKAEEVYRAMAYQVAKEIGAMAVVLQGAIDAVVLTGGLAHSQLLTNWIKEQIQFLAPVYVFPGEDELRALAQGGLRVLTGAESPKAYE